mmetsp:Transcript_44193/g.64979  ORF Transcript_44193/g.64979 Transcript_44193/m.64979 type:complete len:236 (+) Transcript_44193:351-1058(+)
MHKTQLIFGTSNQTSLVVCFPLFQAFFAFTCTDTGNVPPSTGNVPDLIVSLGGGIEFEIYTEGTSDSGSVKPSSFMSRNLSSLFFLWKRANITTTPTITSATSADATVIITLFGTSCVFSADDRKGEDSDIPEVVIEVPQSLLPKYVCLPGHFVHAPPFSALPVALDSPAAHMILSQLNSPPSPLPFTPPFSHKVGGTNPSSILPVRSSFSRGAKCNSAGTSPLSELSDRSSTSR